MNSPGTTDGCACDITIEDYLPNDHPYGAWLHGLLRHDYTSALHDEDADWGSQVQKSVELQLGVVGPAAGGAEVQKWVHEIMDDKDPKGWQEFYDQFVAQSAKGHALTMRGVQMSRPSIFDLEAAMERLEVPTLIVTGDEDDPCLEPGIFMKRKIRSSGLVVMPKAGHTINLEDPDTFNRALLDFLTAVDAGRWPLRNPQSQTGSAIMPAQPKPGGSR